MVSGVKGGPDVDRPRDAAEALRRRLVQDTQFLAVPISEKATASQLGIHASVVREAVIGFVASGWLIRSPQGLCRDILDSRRLAQLFAIRLQIERASVQRLLNQDQSSRRHTASLLFPIVNRQMELAECDEDDTDSRIAWYYKSIEFHTHLAEIAALSELARLLELVLWKTRIGSCLELEEQELRREVTRQHFSMIDDIMHRNLALREFVNEHISAPMKRTFEQHKMLSTQQRGTPTFDTAFQEYWHMVETLFLDEGTSPSESERRTSE